MDDQNEHMRLLSSLTRLHNTRQPKDSIIKNLLKWSVDSLDTEAGTVAMLEESTDNDPDLKFQYTYGLAAKDLEGICLKTGQGLIGWVVSNNQPVIVNDVSADERFFKWIDQESGFQTRSVICVPIKLNKRIVGALELLNKKDRPFSEEDRELLVSAVNLAAASIEKSQFEDDTELKYLKDCLDAAGNLSELMKKTLPTDLLILELLNTLVAAADADIAVWFEISSGEDGQLITEFKYTSGHSGGIFPIDLSRLQNLNLKKDLLDWYPQLKEGNPFFASIDTARGKAYEIIDELEVRQLLIMPVNMAGAMLGFFALCFSMERVPGYKAIQNLLQMTAYALSSHLTNELSQIDMERLEHQIRNSQKLESLGEISSGIAHNFRNILAGISANCQLVQMKYHDHLDVQKSISGILNLAQVGSELVNNLLKFSRKGAKPQKSLFNLAEVLEDTYKIIDTSFDKKIDIRKNWDDTLPVEGSRAELSHVAMNLCTNARDAMKDGGILQITARVHQNGGKIYLAISDTGCGMAEETQKKVFDPFFTTKEPGKGTGLGLSTAYGIIKDLGGEINLNSKVGMGTIFQIYLPIASNKGLTQSDEKQTFIKPLLKGNGEKILVIDDDMYLLDTVKDLLESIGYQVETAPNGEIGVQQYTSLRPEVVFVDRSMPGMDGEAVADHILNLDARARIVIVSGYDKEGPDGLSSHIRDAISAYVTKPFDISEVSQLLAKILNSKSSAQLPN